MDINKLISDMTLEEKAGLLSGLDFWRTKPVERLGIPSLMVSDGPHGLRTQEADADHLGLNESIKAVCFPAGCALAASFDKSLINQVGSVLGNECQAEGVGVLLGPAVNIKRSPLCGRNFEYFSEDPLLTSAMAASFIKGVQSRNVGTSIKHFLANNQEYRRMSSSSEVDERTLREIYLAAFEYAVKESKPWTVMCSYNRINGVYAAENETYLTDVLRKEWGFDGFVVSDWGAVNDRVPDLAAGLDLEMPDSNGINDKLIVEAVESCILDEAVVDRAAARILGILERFEKNRKPDSVFDRDADHEKARQTASECIVLLKNEDILPLSKDKQVAFIGGFAEKPRYQGGGSSHINASKIESALQQAEEYKVTYTEGFDTKTDIYDDKKADDALKAASAADIVVVFAGLPDIYESEGFDREHMRLPANQNRLIEELSAVNPNIVVVLHNGSPVEMPWVDKVKGLFEAYLGGQAVGGAVVQCLYGDVNPSGRLAETFPLKLQDNPSYLFYKGEKDTVEYREGVFVGYRYYDKKEMEVLFPFGHGLSYTSFEYSNLKISKQKAKDTDTDTVEVSLDVTNTGKVRGKEVVQLYVSPPDTGIIRPVQELKGFEKIELAPGQTVTVSFVLSKRSFAYFNTEIHDWYAESGVYEIRIGKSSRNIVLSGQINIESTVEIPVVYHMNSTLGDMMKTDYGKEVLKDAVRKFTNALSGSDPENEVLGEGTDLMFKEMINNMPLRNLVSFGGALDFDYCRKILEKMNKGENDAE